MSLLKNKKTKFIIILSDILKAIGLILILIALWSVVLIANAVNYVRNTWSNWGRNNDRPNNCVFDSLWLLHGYNPEDK